MKFSYNWLREMVPGLKLDPAALERLITIKTAECEGVEVVGSLLPTASVARVLSVELIADSHNRKAVVETERYGQKTVVCGAPNCRVGLRTVYAPVGLKNIGGVESDGMLASGSELGVNQDHAGIVELAEGASIPGEPDHVIEVDNKSLTHRPDLWGHLGMAREVAAIAHGRLQNPVQLDLLPEGEPAILVEIADLALCPRYSALVFENATVQPSPLWVQYRLESIGLNPINNIVDVTNLLAAELAQPTHAFDADRLHGSTIFVRRAEAGEKFAALNHETYELNPSNLVIADAQGAVAIAGVMGGLHSAIDESTTRIVFESANFQASSVRKTSTQLKLRTDASMRFEKSQDPVNTTRALARAIELLREVSPGIRLVGGVADVKAEPKTQPVIELSVAWLTRKLGRAVTSGEVRGILEALEFGVTEETPGVLRVTVPTWRATKDVSMKDDLLEEVGRMIGYDAIAPQAPSVLATPPLVNPERLFLRRLRQMASAQGFTEVYNYSFLSEDAVRRFGMHPEDHLRVTNPIASDQTLMRLSLLPGIWKNITQNSRHLASFRFFEIGREIHPRPAGLPDEAPHLMAVVYSREGDGSAGLFELKHLAECLMPGAAVESAEASEVEHPQRSGRVEWRGEAVGRLFELHPALGVEGRAAILDLDLRHVQRLEALQTVKYQPLRRYPTSAFDLSVVVLLREPAGAIERRLRTSAGTDLVAIEFVRQYVGAPLAVDQKSVSYRITIGAPDRTLASDEVTAVRDRVIEAVRQAGYQLRI